MLKQKTAAVILIFSMLSALSCAAAAPELSVPSAVLTDASSGLVLFDKNKDARVYPASTTKIMTAIIAIEHSEGHLSDMFTASFEAVNSISFDSSKANLLEGEQMSYCDLIFALLIASANDAANVLAENIAGSSDEFVKLMNEKAAVLGASSTHFQNAHGLHHENHYTTAADMAKIARYAMTLPLFREAVSSREYTIPATNMQPERKLVSTNQLLSRSSKYYYEYAAGVKTGYTTEAGYCLVSAAETSDRQLIAAVFGADPKSEEMFSFIDSKKLLSYGINTLKSNVVALKGDILSSVPLRNSYADDAILEASETISVVLPEGAEPSDVTKNITLNKNISAPIEAGEVLGNVEFLYGGTPIATCNLVAVSQYKKMPLAFIFRPVYKLVKSVGLYITAAIAVGFLLLISAERKRKAQIKRRKMRETRRKEDMERIRRIK